MIRLYYSFVFLFIISLFACDEMNETILPDATGKPGDLLVVIDTSYYNNQLGDTIKSIFSVPQEGLPQREPLFNLISLPVKNFATIFQTTRNIIIVNINKNNKPAIKLKENQWANDQLVVSVDASDAENALAIFSKNKAVFLDYFQKKELDRLKAKLSKIENGKNVKLVKEHFGFKLLLDDLFILAKKDDGFMWFRKEKDIGGHPLSQGIIIYTYPYDNDSIFDVKQLVAKRNYYTEKYLKNSRGAYMTSYEEYLPNGKEINLNGYYAKELRGLWHMKGDFMGGPYINISLVDEKNNRLVCIDGYVYCPKFDKREYLRELEAIAKTIQFN